MLESALVAGICSVGADALRVGIIPTPGVAFLAKQYDATAGVVISASHNPMEYNGIKFFGAEGFKLPDEIEDQIEELVVSEDDCIGRPAGGEVGRVYDGDDAERKYIDHLLACYRGKKDLTGITMVVDCAHGASFKIAPEMWRELGARVIAINDRPNGININDKCGSTYPEVLRKAVLANKADFGVAYDGDADRVITVDERGNIVDGDQFMVICGLYLKRTGQLNPPKVVATVMSNIGLEVAFRREGVQVLDCQVGDRYVLERMLESGALLGGEQSGHIIFLGHATTGDGLLSSLKLAEVIRDSGLPLSELAGEMERYPQILVNLDIKNKDSILESMGVKEAITKAEQRLGEFGKVLVRPSGTEPKVRIMAQGPDEFMLQEVIDEIKEAVYQSEQARLNMDS
jgi:phosphoglucosamine mutase